MKIHYFIAMTIMIPPMMVMGCKENVMVKPAKEEEKIVVEYLGDGPYSVDRYYDKEKDVYCWTYRTSIYCIPDRQLKGNADDFKSR